MPIYDFYCQDCNKKFESLEKFEVTSLPCTICGSPSIRLVSSPHFVFKGRGFYATDHPKPLKIPDDIANATEEELDRDLGLTP